MAHIFRILILKMHLSIFLAPSASFRPNVQVLSSNVILPRINLQNLKIAEILRDRILRSAYLIDL